MGKNLYIDYPIWVPRGVKPNGYDEYLQRFPHLFDDDPHASEEKRWEHVAKILVRRRQEENIRYVEAMFK
jgi:hypothetical protein